MPGPRLENPEDASPRGRGASAVRPLSPSPGEESSHVAQRTEVPELAGIDDRPHPPNLPVGDVERHHPDQPTLAVEQERARLSVDVHVTDVGSADLEALARPGQKRSRHAPAPVQRPGERGDLAAAVAVQHDVVREQRLERAEVALSGGGEEPTGQLLALLPRGLEARAALLDATARPRGQLARARLLLPTISAISW